MAKPTESHRSGNWTFSITSENGPLRKSKHHSHGFGWPADECGSFQDGGWTFPLEPEPQKTHGWFMDHKDWMDLNPPPRKVWWRRLLTFLLQREEVPAVVTRDEFIDAYMARGSLSASYRTEDGYRIGDRRRLALPCACGEEICEGWAMVPEDLRSDHERLNPQHG